MYNETNNYEKANKRKKQLDIEIHANKQTQETQCFPLPPISGNCKVLCNKSNKKTRKIFENTQHKHQ